jgi:hypothetical protein
MRSLLVPGMIVMLSAAMMAQTAKPSPRQGGPAHADEQESAPQVQRSAPVDNGSLPVGTAVRMKLETALMTSTTAAGQDFAGRVTQDVVLNGRTVIPVGSTVRGKVARVSEPRRIKGRPSIDLRPDQVTLPNGDVLAMTAFVVDADQNSEMQPDEEGKLVGPGRDRRDNLELAAGAGGGALIGGLTSGGKGVLVGSVIGAGAASVRWLTRRHSAVVAPGTEIIMELSRPMVLTASGD